MGKESMVCCGELASTASFTGLFFLDIHPGSAIKRGKLRETHGTRSTITFLHHYVQFLPLLQLFSMKCQRLR